MAASRRQNLREGLVELHRRKVRRDRVIETRSTNKREAREKLVQAPQREDERLTAPTITAATRKLQVGVLEDPGRESRLAEMMERVKAKEFAREEQRRDALHTLYMHARSFITTESQLDAEIDKQFIEKPFEHIRPGALSVWDAHGAPPTVQDMLSEVNGTQKKAMNYHTPPSVLTGKRVLRIAEELTGGKMD